MATLVSDDDLEHITASCMAPSLTGPPSCCSVDLINLLSLGLKLSMSNRLCVPVYIKPIFRITRFTKVQRIKVGG